MHRKLTAHLRPGDIHPVPHRHTLTKILRQPRAVPREINDNLARRGVILTHSVGTEEVLDLLRPLQIPITQRPRERPLASSGMREDDAHVIVETRADKLRAIHTTARARPQLLTTEGDATQIRGDVLHPHHLHVAEGNWVNLAGAAVTRHVVKSFRSVRAKVVRAGMRS